MCSCKMCCCQTEAQMDRWTDGPESGAEVTAQPISENVFQG